MNWKNLREVLMAVIGLALILLLIRIDSEIDRNGRNSDGGRALVCLQLKAQGQPVEDYEPCMRPDVYVRWKDEPIATLSERLCETGAKTEGCPE